MTNDEPRIYVACPLSSRSEEQEEELRGDCRVIAEAIVDVSLEDEPQWACGVHAPINHTSPKLNDDPPREIWLRNRREVQALTDALIAHGDGGGSNGVGQEITWAFDASMPLLYVHPQGHVVSRQLLGMSELSPTFDIVGFADHDELRAAVTLWTRRHRTTIEQGPETRRLLAEAWEPLRQAAIQAWIALSHTEQTVVTVCSRMDAEEIDDALELPLFLARLPVHKLHALVGALDLDLTLVPVPALPRLKETEMAAFDDWLRLADPPHPDAVAALAQARLARAAEQQAAAARAPGFDLTSVEGWTDLHRWGRQ